MKARSLLLAVGAAQSALAHTAFTHFYVNGVSQGLGVAMRMNTDADKASFPVEDLASDDMTCGFDGTKGVQRVKPVQDGSTLTFEFHSWPNDFSKESLDPGHKGPCAVYLKKVDDSATASGTGDGWFKIWSDGYDADSDIWCTDKMIDNNGRMSVVLPEGLQGGYYLARPELLALHAAASGDPQFYTGCAQIFLESKGNLVPESTVSIPGYVKAGQPSVSWDIYNDDNSKYPVPGPNVSSLVAGASTSQTTQTKGLKPDGCIDENANWCGYEVPSYTDETGCWAANQDCWNQDKTCWTPYSPIGGAGCEIWEKKCNEIEDACKAGDFTGPPNKGKNLTPNPTTIKIGLIMATSGVSGSPKTADVAEYSSSIAVVTSAAAKPTSVAAVDSSSIGGYGTIAGETSRAAGSTSEAAPAPTSIPGVYYETVYETIVRTEYEYVTMYDKKRRNLHARRHLNNRS